MVFLLCLSLAPAAAQTGTWRNYTSMRSVTGVARTPQTETYWASTSGGLFRWERESGTFRQTTSAEGLRSVDLTAVAVDSDGRVWMGARTGVLHALDPPSGNLITVVDIAASALDAARARLGARAGEVTWLVGDVTTIDLPVDAFDVWHDRAVFHFLTSEADRSAYLERLCSAVKKGGHVVMATFGPQGPEKCSGLPVVRYSADQVHAAFGDAFRLIEHEEERHRTPWGTEQEFVYCLCVRDRAC